MALALGVAETPAFPANNALVSRWFPTKERGLATGAYTAGEYVGLAIAAPLLAWMAVTYGWHSVFYLTGGLGLVFAFVWLIFIRNSPQSDKRVSRSEIDLIEKGGGAVKTAHPEGGGGEHAKFSDIPKLLRHKRMVGALIGQFANTSTLFFFLTWFPTYLVEQKHFTLLKAGIMVTIPYLVALLGTLAAGSWSDWMLRRGVATTIARKTPIISGLILSMIVIFDNFREQPGARHYVLLDRLLRPGHGVGHRLGAAVRHRSGQAARAYRRPVQLLRQRGRRALAAGDRLHRGRNRFLRLRPGLR